MGLVISRGAENCSELFRAETDLTPQFLLRMAVGAIVCSYFVPEVIPSFVLLFVMRGKIQVPVVQPQKMQRSVTGLLILPLTTHLHCACPARCASLHFAPPQYVNQELTQRFRRRCHRCLHHCAETCSNGFQRAQQRKHRD